MAVDCAVFAAAPPKIDAAVGDAALVANPPNELDPNRPLGAEKLKY